MSTNPLLLRNGLDLGIESFLITFGVIAAIIAALQVCGYCYNVPSIWHSTHLAEFSIEALAPS